MNKILILQSHLWAPETQKGSVKVRLIAPLYVIEADRVLQTLANQYGLSYRLVKMMCTDPVMQMETAVAEPNILEMSVTSNKSEEKTQQNVSSGDLEGAYHLDQLDPVAASAEVASLGYLSFSNIINHIWHFCSVDYGPKCKSRSVLSRLILIDPYRHMYRIQLPLYGQDQWQDPGEWKGST